MTRFVDKCFLCGYFSTTVAPEQAGLSLASSGWSREVCTRNDVDEYRRFYYPEFVDFWLGDGGSCPVTTFSVVYAPQVPVDDVVAADAGCTARLRGMRLCMMPLGMALYAVEVDLEGDDLNAFTLFLSRLRSRPEASEAVAAGLCQIRSSLGLDMSAGMMESGNKLKVFQIVRCLSADGVGAVAADATLFQLGSLSRVAPYDPSDPAEISAAYLDSTIRDHKLSFYNNWSALALFDTFTILAGDVPDWMVGNWCDDYFGKIYMHSLFCKYFLYRQNMRFRACPERGDQLEEELNEFERRYCFNRISYNFMPGEIDKAIDRALDIAQERRLLQASIRASNEERSKASDRRLNSLLTLLTVLTVASTLWDFSSMVNALYPFGEGLGSETTGFRLVVSVTMLLILVAVICIVLPRKVRRLS